MEKEYLHENGMAASPSRNSCTWSVGARVFHAVEHQCRLRQVVAARVIRKKIPSHLIPPLGPLGASQHLYPRAYRMRSVHSRSNFGCAARSQSLNCDFLAFSNSLYLRLHYEMKGKGKKMIKGMRCVLWELSVQLHVAEMQTVR